MSLIQRSNKIGVVIARFQVPELHNGHKYLMQYIINEHDRVLVLLGVAPIKLSENDPLNFEIRKQMILKEFGFYDERIKVLPIYDQKQSDENWSNQVDKIIQDAYFVNEHGAVLYGSRDSFIPHYKGIFLTKEIEPISLESGTNSRVEASKTIVNSSDFRKGVIYGVYDKFPFVYSCVDVAILDDSETRILLGRKINDLGCYRFIGGFVDPTDSSDFMAARREASEETGLEVEPYAYVGSALVNDWRYAKEKNCKIMTRLIKARDVFGHAKAGDDINEVKWFNIKDIKPDDLVFEHRPLFEALCENLKIY